MSVELYRESAGKFDSRTLSRKTLSRWTGRMIPCMRARALVRVYMHICTCVCVCICMCMYVYLCVSYVCVCMYIYIYICVSLSLYIYIYIYIYVCTYIYISVIHNVYIYITLPQWGIRKGGLDQQITSQKYRLSHINMLLFGSLFSDPPLKDGEHMHTLIY